MKKFDRIDFLIIVIVTFLLGVMVVPRYINDQVANDRETCLTNIRKIAFAKQKWAADNNGEKGDSCTMEDLVPEYLPEKLKCPSGTKDYTVSPIEDNPVCPNQLAGKVKGHTLPVRKKAF
ncbi:hypothetical protein KAI19_01740 [bacterium]|nr:hypothetical protein [bacterium]